MAASDELFSMDIDVVQDPPKPSRFQPKVKGKDKVKAEASSSPLLALTRMPPAAESISHSVKMEPSEVAFVPYCNGVNRTTNGVESSSMDIEDEEDVVVQELDVYINPYLDADTKLYNMQHLERPYFRPYEMNERCNEVWINPKSSQIEIQLSFDTDNEENYDLEVDDNSMITTLTLLSSSKPFANDVAVGFLKGNNFYVTPLHEVVQFRPSMSQINGVQKMRQGGHHLQSNLKPVENVKESLQGKVMQDDAKEANELINTDEPWVLLEYHAGDSTNSLIYSERALTDGRNRMPLDMKLPDYVNSFDPATSGCMRKTIGSLKRDLLTKPLEDRLKQWLSEGPQVNRFTALLHLAPNDSVEDVLTQLQRYAYLVQGLWVSKSSLFHDGLPALYRDYILLQFSKLHAVHDSKLKVVKPEDLRKSLLKPLAVERPLLQDWKFKEDTDSSFIKQYPEIVKEQELAWSVREKEILESLPAGGRSFSSVLKNYANLGISSKPNGSIEPGHNRDRSDLKSSVFANMPNKRQEPLAKSILELLHLYKVLSLNSIIQGLQGKTNAGSAEVQSAADQIALKIHDIYVLKSLGKPTLDQFRNVVIEYFIGKGRNAKVKKQEIKLAAQYRLKRVVSDVDYGQVMNELCVSSGGSWMLKSGALK
ncbi:DNA-directed RNA polymerase III subunit RPC5 isoform X2 [Phalaenopsis equestris]|uniref:DNA-directed RNA polymerase III subunit RPC5 isoform X2 n=1 Tax=Phalaenopsis equestris TaxID=78828 RepID=UPI0009E4945B|nr:DNA-directed RNA polymerase III subunit RPC5 isoform X2 [Phalaenopsis equestris]